MRRQRGKTTKEGKELGVSDTVLGREGRSCGYLGRIGEQAAPLVLEGTALGTRLGRVDHR